MKWEDRILGKELRAEVHIIEFYRSPGVTRISGPIQAAMALRARRARMKREGVTNYRFSCVRL
jgi:hypothetical protein